MTNCMDTINDFFRDWLRSGQAARLSGLDVRPIPHPHLDTTPQCIIKGQACVYFLEQVPQGNHQLLKVFTPGRRPTDEYLRAVDSCIPGTPEFFTCTQRRFLRREHLSLRASSYKNPALAEAVEGAIMMPKVPGISWVSMADELRNGDVDVSLIQRVTLSLALARCIDLLEAGQCSHRDLSSGNVFVDYEGRVWLIDWDCLYHPNLPFQPNTTVGTMGYAAPFLKVTGGNANPTLSWCPLADRFSLAVLVTEFLLTGPDIAPSQEDGTLFSQSQIDEPGNGFVREMVTRLKQVSRPCGTLLERAFSSSAFAEGPSPQEWVGALRWTQRTAEKDGRVARTNGGQGRLIHVQCAECGASFRIRKSKCDELTNRNKRILCRNCFGDQHKRTSIARARRKLDYPMVSCEHCQKALSLPREKLDALRHRGRPILCSACLRAQLKTWQNEQAKDDLAFSHIACEVCGRGFRLRKEKLAYLRLRGKTILCRDCLDGSQEGRLRTGSEASATTTVSTLKPLDFIRRILYGRSA